MAFMVRPLATLLVSRSRLRRASATSSRDLISNQFSRFSPALPRILTSDQRPFIRSPSSVNTSLPAARPSSGSPSGVQAPRSHSITEPPPYSPLGITPSNSA